MDLDITISSGSPISLLWPIVDSNGNPINLTGQTVQFVIFQNTTPNQTTILTLTSGSGLSIQGTNQVLVSLTGAQSAIPAFCRYQLVISGTVAQEGRIIPSLDPNYTTISSSVAVLQGPPGPTGATGATGATGPAGTTTTPTLQQVTDAGATTTDAVTVGSLLIAGGGGLTINGVGGPGGASNPRFTLTGDNLGNIIVSSTSIAHPNINGLGTVSAQDLFISGTINGLFATWEGLPSQTLAQVTAAGAITTQTVTLSLLNLNGGSAGLWINGSQIIDSNGNGSFNSLSADGLNLGSGGLDINSGAGIFPDAYLENYGGDPGLYLAGSESGPALRIGDADGSFSGAGGNYVMLLGSTLDMNDGSGYGGGPINMDAGSIQNVGTLEFSDGTSMTTASSGGGGGSSTPTYSELTVTGNNGGNVTIEPFPGHTAWIDMPALTGYASGIGSGGPGSNPWIAFAGGNDQWFSDSSAGDICYRNTGGRLLFGATNGGASQVQITSAAMTVTTPCTINTLTIKSLNRAVVSKTVSYTLTTTDSVVLGAATGAITFTLPTAVGNTREYTLKSNQTTTVTVATTSSQTIDGVTTYSLSAKWKYVVVQSDGSNWQIVGNN